MAAEFRLATPQDGRAIFDLLCLMHAEVALAPLNPEKLARAIVYTVEHGMQIVGELDGRIIATAALIVDSWWYSDEQFLRDLWVFVHPDHRRSNVAAGLVEHVREAAEIWGLPLVISVFGSKDSGRKIQWMSRRMQQMGGLFYEGR